MIREEVMKKLAKNKSIELAFILTLLNTYMPLSISIYSVIFKSSNFEEFK